jgi:hypothetical protein
MWKKYVGALIDTDLYEQFQTFEQLPVLERSIANNWCLWMWCLTWTAIGFLYSLALIKRDPCFSIVGIVGSLIATGLIALKQWRYYYGGRGVKDGVFVLSIRQGSNAESFLDRALAAAGGVLLGMTVLPTWWFATVALYSAFVFMRCLVTLNRFHYWARAGSPPSLSFIPDALLATNAEKKTVGEVLAGWVFTHSVVFILGWGVSLFLHRRPSSVSFGIALPSFFLVFFLGLRPLSHGGKVCPSRILPLANARDRKKLSARVNERRTYKVSYKRFIKYQTLSKVAS